MVPEGQDRGAEAVALLEDSRSTLEGLDLPLDVPGAAEARGAVRPRWPSWTTTSCPATAAWKHRCWRWWEARPVPENPLW